MFAGPSGLGKTTLASIVATEMDADIHITSGPALERESEEVASEDCIELLGIYHVVEPIRTKRDHSNQECCHPQTS